MDNLIKKGKMGGRRANSGRKSGFIGYWKGKKRPDAKYEHLRNYDKFGKDNIFSKIKFCADKHPRWSGGKWIYWRKQALIRDNYTCQECNLYDPDVMQVDHIDSSIKANMYSKINHNINNLKTLCANCHARKTIKRRREKAKNKSFYSL
jgi:hypothetical protein